MVAGSFQLNNVSSNKTIKWQQEEEIKLKILRKVGKPEDVGKREGSKMAC